MILKNLMIGLTSLRSKKGVNKSKELLKSYELSNDNADILTERLKTIKKDDNHDKKRMG